MSTVTLDELVAAIRDSDTDMATLRRMVGPSQEANEAAELRVRAINAMYDKHPTLPRELWPWEDRTWFDTLTREQEWFEAQYC